METTGYVNSVRDLAAERCRKIREVIDLVHDTVRDYAGADGLLYDDQVALPEVDWGDDGSRAWLAPYGGDAKQITYAEVDASMLPVEHFVGSAVLMLSDKGADAEPMFTISVNQSNVLGYDGVPLKSDEIDGVMVDLRTYRSALDDIYRE